MTLGLSPLYNDTPIKINIDDMWSNHSAIFGNTGSGKTYGVARVVQNLFTMPNYIPLIVLCSYLIILMNMTVHLALLTDIILILIISFLRLILIVIIIYLNFLFGFYQSMIMLIF